MKDLDRSADIMEHQKEKGAQKHSQQRKAHKKQKTSSASPHLRISAAQSPRRATRKSKERARSAAKQIKSRRGGEARFDGFGPLSARGRARNTGPFSSQNGPPERERDAAPSLNEPPDRERDRDPRSGLQLRPEG